MAERLKCDGCGKLFGIEDIGYIEEPDRMICKSCIDITARVMMITTKVKRRDKHGKGKPRVPGMDGE